MAEIIPLKMSGPNALDHIQELASDTSRIVVIGHAKQRQKERNITRRQIEICVQTGFISEGPFLNQHGNWQVNMTARHAGEEMTCVVAIEWATRLLIITAF